MNPVADPSLTDDVPLDSILALLEQVHLPTADIAPGPRQRFIGARADEQVCGVVAIEPLGDIALLRSLAVAPAYRSAGLGRKLVDAALARARALGVQEIYLLTTDAAEYFSRLGFAAVAREDVPAAIRASTQFATLCPASATVMHRAV